MYILVVRQTDRRAHMDEERIAFLEELLKGRLSYITFLGKQQERILLSIEERGTTQEERMDYWVLHEKQNRETQLCKAVQEELRVARLPVTVS